MFILSKVLLFLLFPITWILLLLTWAIITQNQKLRLRLLISGLALLYLFSIPLLLDLYARAWDYPAAQLNKASYSAAIVLGGFSSENRNGGGYFNGAADRFIEGVKLYETGKASHILISSGSANLIDKRFKEADWVHQQLQQFNVPDSVIIIENRSRNTIENALYSNKALKSERLPPPYLLVTSAFHLRRAMLIFKKAGIEVIPYPCNFSAGINKITAAALMPSAQTLFTWEIYTKELVGYVVASISQIK